MLDRVLRRHHQKQTRQLIGGHAHADLAFAHRFQQGRLHLGRCTVDLVGQYKIVKQWPALKTEAAVFGTVNIGTGEIGRQHIGGELHALEVALQAMRQRLDRAGFGQAGRTLDQQMTLRQQRNQQAFHQRRLAENLGVEVSLQLFEDFKITAWGFC